MPDYATYHVAMKLLLWKGDEVLLLKLRNSRNLDLPGGRIDDNEDSKPLLEILEREVTEELGQEVKYEVGPFLFHYRAFFPKREWRAFVNVYVGTYLGGDIKLSGEHSNYEWINPRKRKLDREEFLSEEAYHAFVNYFKRSPIEVRLQ